MTTDVTNSAYRHGHAGKSKFSPTYHSWSSMIQRCTNPNRQFWKRYGGRGIAVCDRWLRFDNFLADMGERPKGTSLDRIDNDGDYEPSNCKWSDRKTQARNASHVVLVEIAGATKPLAAWCEERGISINTVRNRVKFYGMSYADAVTKPKQSVPFRRLGDER